jgi:hypothetical protein
MTDSNNIASMRAPVRTLRNVKARTIRPLMSEAQFNKLLRAASHRGVDPGDLAGRIISTVLEHNLIKAVLDDEV